MGAVDYQEGEGEGLVLNLIAIGHRGEGGGFAGQIFEWGAVGSEGGGNDQEVQVEY